MAGVDVIERAPLRSLAVGELATKIPISLTDRTRAAFRALVNQDPALAEFDLLARGLMKRLQAALLLAGCRIGHWPIFEREDHLK